MPFERKQQPRLLPSEQERVDELQPFGEQATRFGQQSLDYMQRLQSPAPIVNTPEAQASLQTRYGQGMQQAMTYHADKGQLTSAALSMAQATLLQQRAYGAVSLRAQEEAERRARMMEAEQQLKASQEASRELPEWALAEPTEQQRLEAELRKAEYEARARAAGGSSLGMGPPSAMPRPAPVFEEERQKAKRMQDEASRLIGDFQTRRPTEEQLRSTFQKTVDEAYAAEEQQHIAAARRRGMSEDFIEGLRYHLAKDREEVMNEAAQYIGKLTGPNAQEAATALSAMYTPEKLQLYEQTRNPMAGVLFGLAGAAIGGLVPGGSIAGAQLGYGLGSATGGVLFG